MLAKNINDLLGREVTNKDYYNLQEIVIADNVDNIFPLAFYKFRKLTSVIIPKGVKTIESKAFFRCRHLKSIRVSSTVQEIGWAAFANCTNLESLVVDKNNDIFDSRDNCNAIISTKDNTLIAGCTKTIIPNGVKKIGPFAFMFDSEIQMIRIPESLHFFSINTFRNRSGIISIEVDENNTIFDSRDNCNAIIRRNGNKLIYGCNNSTIPNGIEVIDYRAFDGCTGLTSAIIPDSVHTVGAYAFSGCTNLSSVKMSDSVTSIGEGAFRYCKKLKTIIIPKESKGKFEKLLSKYKNKICEQ